MASVQDLKRRIQLRPQHAQDHAGDGARRRGEAAPRRAADRGDAAVRRDDERAHRRGRARAAASVRLPLLEQRENVETVAIVPLTGDRGLAGAFNAQVLRRAFALERSLQAEGKKVRWVAVGKKGRSTLHFRRRELAGAYIGFTDRPAYEDAQAIAHRVVRALHRGRGRPRRPRLQHVRLGAHAARDRAGRAADLGRHPRDRRGGARRRHAARRLHLRARAGGDPRSACCRSTSRRRSTARCSSRPPRSRARG